MKSPEAFRQFYHSDLLPHLQELETKRQNIVGKLKWTGGILVALTLISLVGGPIAAGIAFVISFIIFAGLYSTWTGTFVTEFKENIIRRIITFVDPGLSYHKDGHVPLPVYMGSQLFTRSPDRYKGEDLVQGMVDKTAISFSELHAEYKSTRRDSKGRTKTTWHTIFKGVFFVADFNKHFHGETLVVPDTAERLLGRLGRALQSMDITRKGALLHMDDVEFERLFAVYSTDQVEARYILTPALMARITEFAKRTGHEVHISFVHDHIHVAIPHTKDLFEPSLIRSLLDESLAKEYLDDLMLVVGIVEDLSLNTRIWTKQ